jgi:hypothetical protein
MQQILTFFGKECMKCTLNVEVMFVGAFNAHDDKASGALGFTEGM